MIWEIRQDAKFTTSWQTRMDLFGVHDSSDSSCDRVDCIAKSHAFKQILMAAVDDNFPDRSSTWPDPGSSPQPPLWVSAPHRCFFHTNPRLEQFEIAHIQDLQQPCQLGRYNNGEDAKASQMTRYIFVQVHLGTIPHEKNPCFGIEAVNDTAHTNSPLLDDVRCGKATSSMPILQRFSRGCICSR